MADAGLLTRPFLLCFVANLLQGLAFNLFLHFPGYLKLLGADELRIGFISALTAVAAIALRPPIGRAMDRYGRRPVILAGGVVNVLVVGLYLTIDGIGPWLYAVRVVHGLAEALLFSSLFTFAADTVPATRRTQGLALFGVSGMLPISLAGVYGDWMLPRHGYEALFASSLVLAVASLLASLPLRDVPRRRAEPGQTVGFRAALGQPDLAPLWMMGGGVLGRAHRLLRLHQDLRRHDRHRHGRRVLQRLHDLGARAARLLRLAARPARAEARAGAGAPLARGRVARARARERRRRT